jgi:hypothetical protein
MQQLGEAMDSDKVREAAAQVLAHAQEDLNWICSFSASSAVRAGLSSRT